MPLTRFERETVVSFNESEDVANVFTYNERWQKHLEVLGFKPYRENSFGGKDYAIPKHMIRLPRKKLELSDSERARRVARGQALHTQKPIQGFLPNRSIEDLLTK